jgi:transcriptional regulator with XRE-family HTH domain
MTASTQTGRPHGNAKYRLEGCRCNTCCKASSAYTNNRRRAIAYGRWQPYVDAEPVREHVRSLSEYGIGWIRLARLAGVPRGTMSKLLYGDSRRGLAPSKRLLPKNAQAILAVEPSIDLLGDAAYIDGTGTRRRLQALTAAGWPQRQLALRLGIEPTNFPKLIHGQDGRLVKAGTHRAVANLYDELWRLNPLEHGVLPRWADTARRQAKARRWAPVGAWDDDRIDDPNAFPDWTGWCGTPRGRAIHIQTRVQICPACRNAHTEAA